MAAGRLKNRWRTAWFCLTLIFLLPVVTWSDRHMALHHYGVVVLKDEAVAAQLRARFKATGNPLFLVHNLKVGVAVNDFMKFNDKAVLIDAKVWQTLRAEGALAHLQQAPVVRLRAKAKSSSWQSRATRVASARDQKAYLVGVELLKILEDHFVQVPKSQEMILQFKGEDLILLGPNELLDQLLFREVKKAPERPKGSPIFISLAPERPRRVGEAFEWQAWAVDPDEPSGALQYNAKEPLPEGVEWDEAGHKLKGVFGDTGSYAMGLSVQNAFNLTDTMTVVFKVVGNKPPRIINYPPLKAERGKSWQFVPQIVDPDHEEGNFQLELLAAPAGMTVEDSGGILNWVVPQKFPGTLFEIKMRVTDPAGAFSDGEFQVEVLDSNHAPQILSELSSWQLMTGQKAVYKPVVVDADGDTVQMTIYLQKGGSIQWDKDRFILGTDYPGFYSAEIAVTDGEGPPVRQRLIYQVQRRESVWRGLAIKNALYSGAHALEAIIEKSSVRLGFYFPMFWRNIRDDEWDRKDLPYWFIGANLLSEKQFRRGNYIFTDGGLVLNRSFYHITAGGLMLRLDSRFSTLGQFPGFVEFEFLTSIRQAVLVTETTADNMAEFENEHIGSIRKLFNEYNDKKNILIISQMEGWYPAGFGFWTGPTVWRLDIPLVDRFEQRFGWGLRYQRKAAYYGVTQSLCMGWGGSNTGFAIYWKMKLDLGNWD